jgi:hypothetical protein
MEADYKFTFILNKKLFSLIIFEGNSGGSF